MAISKNIRLKNVTLLFLGFIIMTFVGCSSGNSSSEELSTRLYMTSGETGSLEPTSNDHEYIITLYNVPSDMRWITDRPARKSGIDTTSHFVETVWPENFEVTAPNGILKFLSEDENDGLFVTLKETTYDADGRILRFTATLIRSTFEDGDPRLEATFEFDYPSIVILNNGDGFNFVVHSETATVENTGHGNTYTIVQNDIDDEVLWASSAPSTISDVTTTQRLADDWDAMFAEVPPNAFMFGVTDSGEITSYSITIDTMEYPTGGSTVTYLASILENDPIEIATLNSVTLVIDMDFIGMLMQDYFYGASIAKDVRMVFSFKGTPSTEKEHDLKGIQEDVSCDGANIPTQQDQNRAPSIGDRFLQFVTVMGANLQATKDWMNLGGQGYTEAKKGKLTIGVYSMLSGNEFVQIAIWECQSACAVSYDTNGTIQFLCTGKISWAAKCKTLTGDSTKQDQAGAWNNSTVE